MCYTREDIHYLRCLVSVEANYVMREIYEGIRKNHLGAKSLAHKAIAKGTFGLPSRKMYIDLFNDVTNVKGSLHTSSTPRAANLSY